MSVQRAAGEAVERRGRPESRANRKRPRSGHCGDKQYKWRRLFMSF